MENSKNIVEKLLGEVNLETIKQQDHPTFGKVLVGTIDDEFLRDNREIKKQINIFYNSKGEVVLIEALSEIISDEKIQKEHVRNFVVSDEIKFSAVKTTISSKKEPKKQRKIFYFMRSNQASFINYEEGKDKGFKSKAFVGDGFLVEYKRFCDTVAA